MKFKVVVSLIRLGEKLSPRFRYDQYLTGQTVYKSPGVIKVYSNQYQPSDRYVYYEVEGNSGYYTTVRSGSYLFEELP